MSTGSYFMTEESEHARVGKTLEQLTQARKTLARLREEAREIGIEFKMVGECLAKNPEQLWFQGQTPVVEFIPRFGGPHLYQKNMFDVERLGTLAGEIRELTLEERELASSLRAQGYAGTI